MIARSLFTALLSLLLTACAPQPVREAPPADAPPIAVPEAAGPAAHDHLLATLWMQQSAEYRATLHGLFAVARATLDRALDDPEWNALPEDERSGDAALLPPAIIVDVDETVIDNSPYQARMIRDESSHGRESFTAWVNERRAEALPGAADFLRHAAGRGVTVYYVTNRDAPHELQGTLDNLRALGFPVARDGSNAMLRGDARAPDPDKGARRRWIGERYRVLLLLGDNLGDFVDGSHADPATRRAMVERHLDWWGERWLMLPNPSYGGWESSLSRHPRGAVEGDRRARLRSHLRFD